MNQELSGDILRNNKLTINAAGLTTGLRKMKDGVSFFGTKIKNVKIAFTLGRSDNKRLRAEYGTNRDRTLCLHNLL